MIGCLCIADLKDCLQKVQCLKYAEEACYNGTLIIRAFSSGLEIDTCNWTINGNDLILYSDFSILDEREDVENDNYSVVGTNLSSSVSDNDENWEAIAKHLINTDESLEDMEKVAFVCTCAMDSIKVGGSVLKPIGQLGILLLLLERMSSSLEASTLKVPTCMVSSVAEELLAFSNTIPEWLCKQLQEKLYSGKPLFAHMDLIRETKLHLFPALLSPKLLTIW